jgi:hypothetical protein
MSKPRTQAGYVFERYNGWHIRFYVHENGKPKQRSRKLCTKDADHPSKDSPSVVKLAEDLMSKINEANAVNDNHAGHSCPVCGNRCIRTIQGKFAKKV